MSNCNIRDVVSNCNIGNCTLRSKMIGSIAIGCIAIGSMARDLSLVLFYLNRSEPINGSTRHGTQDSLTA